MKERLEKANEILQAIEILHGRIEKDFGNIKGLFNEWNKPDGLPDKMTMDEFQKLTTPEQIKWRTANPMEYSRMVKT